MKKILVLTDFTPNAAHAAAAALRLSAKMGTGIVLYHTLPFIPLIPGDDIGPYTTEAAAAFLEGGRERLAAEAEKLREVALMTSGDGVIIEERNGEGTLSDVIGRVSEDTEIEMIIMGGRSGGAIEHLLSGSDTATVIRKASKPVLIIPAEASWDLPRKIVFATDFGLRDILAVDFLLRWSDILSFRLDVVHVIKHGEVITNVAPELAFRKFLVKHQLEYSQVPGDSVYIGLQHYCTQHGTDVLAMTHDHHSFVSGLFGKSKSSAAISDKLFSVLVFPPGFKE